MTDQAFGPAETASYDFGDTAAPPEGFDPNATGWTDPPPGIHLMKIDDYKVVCDKDFRWKDETFVLNQIRPQFVIPAGQPNAGAKVIDFLPMPTPGRTWCAGLANRWANFLKSLGFDVPATATVPAGFTLPQIMGHTASVTVALQTDRDGNPKLGNSGLQRVEVKFFGYSRPEASAPSTAGPSQPAPMKQQAFEL